jgi:hypothetical protein
MSNGYFNFTTPFVPHTLGRAEAVNAVFVSVSAAFDQLPDPSILAGLATLGYVAVAKGGTGATTAAGALTSLGAQAALGYVPANKAGDTFTGNLTIAVPTTAAYLTLTTNSVISGYVGTGTICSTGASTDLVVRTDSGSLLFVTNGTTAERMRIAGSTGLVTMGYGLTVSAGTVTFASALGIASGGTGGNTAAAARTALGLGTAALNNTGDFKVGGAVEGIATGGTGATTAAAARAALGAQTTLGYTPANIAGDIFTGNLTIAVPTTAAYLTWTTNSVISGYVGTGTICSTGASTDLVVRTDSGSLLFVTNGTTAERMRIAGSTGLVTMGYGLTVSAGTVTFASALGIASGGTGGNTAAAARTALGAQTTLGYTPANIAGDIFTGNLTVAASKMQVSSTGGVGGASVVMQDGVNSAFWISAIGNNLRIGGAGGGPPAGIINIDNGGNVNFSTALGVASGGTGATTAAAARTALGLGTAALNNTGDFKAVGQVEDIAHGGTGATTAAAARTALGTVAKAGDSFTGQVGISSGLTATPAAVLTTGGPNQGTLRLGNNLDLQGGSDYLGLVVSYGGTTVATFGAAGLVLATALPVASGGTGATTAAAARTALGLGTAALNNTGDFKAVGQVEDIAHGGTGATTAAAARTALGLGSNAIGNHFVQPIGADPTSAAFDIVYEY